MKKERKINLFLYFLPMIVLMFCSCSTKKNSWATRNYHALTTNYNINFNGEKSYSEGIRNIELAQKDDFSQIIPLFPISNHNKAAAATTQMDVAIEKGRKAIKTHSIKKKPKKKHKKASNQEYKNFYEQKEFNPALKQAWLLIGKAEFHKAEFLGAASTFAYIAKEYATNKEMLTAAQLWMARAYTELDWLYEAEQALAKVDQNELKQSMVAQFAETNACLLLKKELKKEAIPFLELALAREKQKTQKIRTAYLLAQLYQDIGDKKEAEKAYARALKRNPPYEMKLNALLNLAVLKSENESNLALKDLSKMSKKAKNKNYLDQIYYAVGKINLQKKDSLKAIENYNLAIKSSVRNGIDKANVLIDLADIHYQQKEYIKAEKAYNEASKIVTTEHKEYKRIVSLSELLAELVGQQQIVMLQDSLLYLSTLPLSEQRKIAEQIISEQEKQENEARKKEEEEKEEREDFDEMEEDYLSQNIAPDRMNAGKWYFYNPSTVAAGKTAFRKVWENRKLEDNWRRSRKSAALFADNSSEQQEITENRREPGEADSEKTQLSESKDPDFYLKQIPQTPAEIASSKAQIADALFQQALILKDKMMNWQEAKIIYKDFIHRFEKDERVPEAYFQLFLIESRENKTEESEQYRKQLLEFYPESRQAKLLTSENYILNFNKRLSEENALYKATYTAYSQNDFKTVSENHQLAKTRYPLSKLLPKFALLDALSSGKSGSSEHLQAKLEELIKDYPESEVSAMAKDIAALIKQGREAISGTSHGSLLSKRELELSDNTQEAEAKKQLFSSDREGSHRLLLISRKEEKELYPLMYEIASFNFTSFMIKEFDIQLNKFNDKKKTITLTNFNSYKEVEWYLNAISNNQDLTNMLATAETESLIISEQNYKLAHQIGFDAYLDFLKNNNFSAPSATSSKQAKRKEVAQSAKQEESKKGTITATADKHQIKEKTNTQAVATESTPSKEDKNKETEQKEQELNKLPEREKELEEKEEKEEELELYKGLFAHQPEKPHFVAIYILNGKVDFEKFKNKLDAYNTLNYNMLNIEISLQNLDRKSMIIVGEFQNAEIAKSYLMRIIKEKEIFETLRGSNYRNLLGSQRNIEIMVKKDALNTYNSFMQEFYLK